MENVFSWLLIRNWKVCFDCITIDLILPETTVNLIVSQPNLPVLSDACLQLLLEVVQAQAVML